MRYIHTIITVLLAGMLAPLGYALAGGEPQVQELTGSLGPGQADVYLAKGLKQGQTLYALMENTSGNLDPILAILPGEADIPAVLTAYQEGLANLVANSADPLLELPALRDKYFLAWDDDSGPGYSAALTFEVPKDGDYYIGASSSLSSAGRETAGTFRILLGLEAPEVLTGSAAPTGAVIAVADQSALTTRLIQEYKGNLTETATAASLKLADLNPGDRLYVRVDATSGDLKPIVLLRDFGNKPVQVANLEGKENSAAFEYTFPEGGTGYKLDIQAGRANEQATSGEFRLQAGVNAPEVLEGNAFPNSGSVLELAIPVKVGFKLQEIVNIDQPNEIMNDVGTIKLEWNDPKLAFDPASCNCVSKEYTEASFSKFLDEVKGNWPDFTFFNQQGNRWTQNRLVQVESNGHVTYVERFTTDFQVDFDWAAFPFDTQDFYIKADMLYPEDQYVFEPMEGFSAIDPGHGEDEFILTDFDTYISSEVASRTVPTSRFTFHFSAPRHKDYYIFRFFIPILLIISVSYITFFLKDYTRRIEIATGNLLLFIAFSFSLGENYPRMGYLTFMDAIMAITFIMNTIVVVLNVYYKMLESKGEREKADRLEAPMNYIYPIAYVLAFGIAAWVFIF